LQRDSHIIFKINSEDRHTNSEGNRSGSINNLFDKSTLASFSAIACKFKEINDACMKTQFMVSKEKTQNKVGILKC